MLVISVNANKRLRRSFAWTSDYKSEWERAWVCVCVYEFMTAMYLYCSISTVDICPFILIAPENVVVMVAVMILQLLPISDAWCLDFFVIISTDTFNKM